MRGAARAKLEREISLRRSARRRTLQHGHAAAICAHGTFSNQRLQYDLLAFRLNEKTPIPAAARRCDPSADWRAWNKRFSAPEIYNNRSSVEQLVRAMALFGFDKRDGFVQVDSCFGGLTLYSLPAIIESGCEYDESTDDCEHVAFNRCLLSRFPDSVYLDAAATVSYDSYAARAEVTSTPHPSGSSWTASSSATSSTEPR